MTIPSHCLCLLCHVTKKGRWQIESLPFSCLCPAVCPSRVALCCAGLCCVVFLSPWSLSLCFLFVGGSFHCLDVVSYLSGLVFCLLVVVDFVHAGLKQVNLRQLRFLSGCTYTQEKARGKRRQEKRHGYKDNRTRKTRKKRKKRQRQQEQKKRKKKEKKGKKKSKDRETYTPRNRWNLFIVWGAYTAVLKMTTDWPKFPLLNSHGVHSCAISTDCQSSC